ncbi:MAG TPA: hypothetical protein VFW33_14690, partial [Gemmataceae bacterium]|nr:hypothetical protein [Gemmataceae bacterium]
MLNSLLMCATLAVGQSGGATPAPAVFADTPYPEGRTIAPADVASPDEATAVALPASLFPSPAAPAAPPPAPVPTRRALPPAFPSPPFPGSEYQGYPLVGLPPDTTQWPLMKAIQGTYLGDVLNDYRIRAYGWLNASANVSTARHSNTPDSYWIVPNSVQLDQAIFRVERQVDSSQTDHIDVGFRSTVLFGMD